MDRIDKIKDIIFHYKHENQKNKAIEELSELIRALSKNDRKNIIEEIADVEIMLSQLKLMFMIGFKELDKIKEEKINKVLFKIRQDK